MRAHQVAAVIVLTLVVCAGLGWAQGWDSGTALWGAQDADMTPLTSWFGGTGLIVTPTAEVLPVQGIQAHIGAVDDDALGWQTLAGINVGFYNGLEAGVTRLDEAYTGGGNEYVIQAKYQIPMQELLSLDQPLPMIAVGGRDLGDQVNQAFYVAVTGLVPLNGEATRVAHLTLGFGEAELSDTPLDGVFLGADFSLFDYARLQAEWDGENFNAALRYWWSKWAVTDVIMLDGDFGGGFTLNTGF